MLPPVKTRDVRAMSRGYRNETRRSGKDRTRTCLSTHPFCLRASGHGDTGNHPHIVHPNNRVMSTNTSSDDTERPPGVSPSSAGSKADHEDTERASVLGDLLHRRIPQVLAGYLGVTWTLFELMKWLTNQYLISPYLGRALLFGLLLLLPSVLLVTYRHGRPGPDEWTSLERYAVSANLVAAVLILVVAFGNVPLGSMVRTVQASGENAAASGVAGQEQQVPKKQFRKRIALFYFDGAQEARADSTLRRAASISLHADLDQDEFLDLLGPAWFSRELKQHGYENGLDVPLGLKRDAAQEANLPYILTGQIGRSEDAFSLTTRLYETSTAKRLSEHRFEGERLFALVDRAATALKKDLQLPAAHRDQATDLPVTQVFTPSLKAAKQYAQGLHLERFMDGQTRNALEHYRKATRADSTFAMGHLRTGTVLWKLGRDRQGRQALRKARRHSYRLTETYQYALKSGWLFRVEGDPEAALQVCEKWTSLHPYDLAAWDQRANIYVNLLRYKAAAQSFRRVVEIAPDAKYAKRHLIVNLLRSGRVERALDAARSYAESYREDEQGPLLAGVAHWHLGNLDRARAAFQRARRTGSDAAGVYLAGLQQAQGRFGEAQSTLHDLAQDSAATRMVRRRARQHLWHHHWLRGRIEKSRAVLDSLNERTDSFKGRRADLHESLRAARTCHYYAREDTARVGTESREVPALVADAVSRTRRIQSDLLGSTAVYEILGEARLARCLLAAGRTEAARRHVNRADSLAGQERIPSLRTFVSLNLLKGRVMEARGNLQGAIDAYRTHLDVYATRREALLRNRLPARFYLARAYRKDGQLDRAADTYEAALRKRPAHPHLNRSYARLLAVQGDAAAATRHLRRALDGWSSADPTFRPKRRLTALQDSLRAGHPVPQSVVRPAT